MLQNEPDDLFLNYALGLEYLNDKETLSLAESQFQFVLKKDTNYIAAYYQLGKLNEELNNKKDALANYQLGLVKAKEQKNNKSVNEFMEAIFMLED